MSKGSKPFKYRDGWRITVTLKNGTRPTKDFDKHADAVQWAAEQLANASADHEAVLGGPNQATVAQALNYYARVYSLHKRGLGAELSRINRYLVAAGMPELEAHKNDQGGIEVRERPRRHVPDGFQTHVGRRRAKRSETNALRDALALKPCGRVSTVSLREFQALMKNEGLSESTAQKEFAMLKVMFNVAMREWSWGGFENPCAGIKLGKSKRRFVKLEPAQREALDAALAECENPYFWPLVFVAKETTLRRETLLELRWSDVDLGDRSTLAPTKTGQVMHKFSKPVQALLLSLPRSPCGRIFPLSKTAVTQAWNRVRTRANLPGLQYRDLRHIGATDWVRRGLTAHVLSKVLGHSTITTAQRYVDLVGDDVGRALDEAMEKCALLQLPPPGLPDAKAQQALNSVRRLQAAVAQSRAGRSLGSVAEPGVTPPLAPLEQPLPPAASPAGGTDATEIFLSLHAMPVLV